MAVAVGCDTADADAVAEVGGADGGDDALAGAGAGAGAASFGISISAIEAR